MRNLIKFVPNILCIEPDLVFLVVNGLWSLLANQVGSRRTKLIRINSVLFGMTLPCMMVSSRD